MNTIKETQAANQAKEIFQNDLFQMLAKFKEESAELDFAIVNESRERQIDEAADVAYVFNQLVFNYFHMSYDDLLKIAIVKNEKKRVK
jgi:phosphoribosyl-ATP pyrophosphohydrolase